MKLLFQISILISSTLFIGCGGGGGSIGNNEQSSNIKQENNRIVINKEYQAINLGNGDINKSILINSSANKSYLLLNNPTQLTSNKPSISLKKVHISKDPKEVIAYRKAIKVKKSEENILLNKKLIEENLTLNMQKIFYLDKNGEKSTSAKLKKIVSKVDTQYGEKSLYIWVSDESFDDGNGCLKDFCVNQNLVDKLANKFLKKGLNNDIYDWVTNIYGQEWGDTNSSYYIQNKNAINILLTDIGDDNSIDNGTIGYFWSKDNTTYLKGSNKEIMFYVDSVIFANNSKGDYWQKEVYATLSHEFAHMIHFYQKTILRAKKPTKTWLNEMLSMATEDIIATKIGFNSITDSENGYGLLSLYNQNTNSSLTNWDEFLYSYAKVASFGAFLIRNYGGAKLLHDIVNSDKTDYQAIVEAIHKTKKGKNKTFDDLIKEWGIAVLFSDIKNPYNQPIFNYDGYLNSTYKSITYKLEPMNFFNIYPSPKISNKIDFVKAKANFFYKIESNKKRFLIDIKNNNRLNVTLIVK